MCANTHTHTQTHILTWLHQLQITCTRLATSDEVLYMCKSGYVVNNVRQSRNTKICEKGQPSILPAIVSYLNSCSEIKCINTGKTMTL